MYMRYTVVYLFRSVAAFGALHTQCIGLQEMCNLSQPDCALELAEWSLATVVSSEFGWVFPA